MLRPERRGSRKSADSHENAVARAMAWLTQHHRKAFAAALIETLDDSLEGIFDDDEQARDALQGVDESLWTQIHINLTEWLLAEGDIEVKGEYQRVAELLLGPGGPLLTVGQRAWLDQLAKRPLRLYDVTESRPVRPSRCAMRSITMRPVIVRERSGSQTLRAGTSWVPGHDCPGSTSSPARSIRSRDWARRPRSGRRLPARTRTSKRATKIRATTSTSPTTTRC